MTRDFACSMARSFSLTAMVASSSGVGYVVAPSNCVREGLGHLALLPPGGAFERLDGAGLINVDHRIELVRETGAEVVALPLCARSVHDADRPLQTRDAQDLPGRRRGLGDRDPERLLVEAVEEALVAVAQRGADPLALGGTAPVVGRRHGARERGEADEAAVAGMPFTHELADVELALGRHLGGASVAKV